MLQHFNTLVELTKAFPDEQSCIDHFRAIRWANGAFCPYCGSTRVYHFKDNRTHKCGDPDCRQRFSIKVGTIFEDTKVPLQRWFMAIWLITSHKRGIASTQLARDIGVTQKTAWFMLHRLRHAARTSSFNAPLKGEVEADETYVGGRDRNCPKRGSGKQRMTPVFGMLQRGGEFRASKVENLSGSVINSKIAENVEAGSTIYTDEHRGYIGLSERFNHQTVTHSMGEYVRQRFIHTNGIEGAWSHFKRQVFGIHHFITAKHLDNYLGEFSWRYNRRKIGEGARVNALLAAADRKRLTYKALIA